MECVYVFIAILFLLVFFLIVDGDLIPILHIDSQFSLSSLYAAELNQLAADSFYIQWPVLVNRVSNIESIGQLIYTYYFYYFIMASLVLLVAMIGAIVLTMHKGVEVKRQDIFEQNTREFTKTVRKLEVNRSRGSLALERLN